jgi:1-deoxy-D-xylulose-5-phosphate synthase
MIVALKDDDMSTAPPVGAMSAYLPRLISSRRFLSRRKLMAAPGNDGTLSKPSLARTI